MDEEFIDSSTTRLIVSLKKKYGVEESHGGGCSNCPLLTKENYQCSSIRFKTPSLTAAAICSINDTYDNMKYITKIADCDGLKEELDLIDSVRQVHS